MPSPVLTRNQAFSALPKFNGASAATNVMTMESTITKTASLFGILFLTAVLGWVLPIVTIPAVLIALVMGIIIAFKKEPVIPLIVGYAIFEGAAVGGISSILEVIYPGVAVQAVLATLVTVGVILALFTSGKIRASARATKVFLVAIVSYLGFSLINLGLSLTGVIDEPFGLYSKTVFGIPIGIIIGILAILIASYSLVLDFTFIQNGITNKIDAKYEWIAGYGILVSVVWIYLEFLRIFGLARR